MKTTSLQRKVRNKSNESEPHKCDSGTNSTKRMMRAKATLSNGFSQFKNLKGCTSTIQKFTWTTSGGIQFICYCLNLGWTSSSQTLWLFELFLRILIWPAFCNSGESLRCSIASIFFNIWTSKLFEERLQVSSFKFAELRGLMNFVLLRKARKEQKTASPPRCPLDQRCRRSHRIAVWSTWIVKMNIFIILTIFIIFIKNRL